MSHWTILCDFDGTVSVEDITDSRLERFARPGWQKIEQAWRRGEIGSHDCMAEQVALLDASREEIDALISARLAEGWSLERLDRPMRAILRAGAYELIARADVPVGSVISEYVDVAHAFYDKRESGFVNGLLDAIAKHARPARAE